MKKILFSLMSIVLSLSGISQLSDGSTAPNWTMTDINGNSHTLYDYLGQGKTVFLQFTATWSAPDYTYHSQGHLNTLHNVKGPGGSDEARVFLIEADASTDSADLYGGGGSTVGDFVTGTNYPIIDNDSQNSAYNIAYYPTIYKVCPIDSTITEVGQVDSTALISLVDNGCGPCQGFSPTADVFADDGNCSGYSHAYGNGGQFPISYYWYHDGSTNQSAYNLCQGTYYVRITDANGCEQDSIPVVVNYDPCANYSIGLSTVFGATSSSSCNGYTSVSASGQGPYTYLWSNGVTTSYDSTLCWGSHWVTITDNIGCVDSAFFDVDSIFDPCAGFNAGVYNVINATTSVSCDGSALADGNLGTAPYTFEWISGGTGNTDNNLCKSNNNWVVVTDAMNCSDTAFFWVDTVFNACDYMQVYENSEDATDGNCDGLAVGVATWGTAPYTYQWNTGATTDSITNLCPGVYEVVITDANGCKDSTDITIEIDCSLDFSSSVITDVSCFGKSDGSFEAIANGTAPYLYSLDSGNTIISGPIFDSLAPGNYFLMSEDANQCYGEYQFTINEPTELLFNSALDIIDASCNGAGTGQISADVSGGTLPYSYQWSNGSVSDTLSSVTAGSYSLVLSDARGCTIASSGVVNEPTAMVVSTSVIADPSCGIDNGSVQVDNVTGGTTPYSYNWTNGSSAGLAENLGAGLYVVTVVDGNGCVVTETVNLTSASAPGVNVSILSPLCFEGNDASIDLTITGGTAPITFDWSTGDQTEDVSGLIAGTYDVTIEDASGCVISEIITISDAPHIDLSNVSEIPASCGISDGSLDVAVTGGTAPYSYLWSTGGTANVENNIAAGSYSLDVTDNNGCVETFTYALSNDGAPVITLEQVIQPACEGGDGMIDVSVAGGTAPYSYAWSGGSTDEDLISATVGEYELVVTDQGGCQGVVYSELEGINLNAAEICLVTVDTATNGNIVVWTKDYGLGIAEYQIFKETAIYNQFQYLNTVPFDSLSQFVDLAANPDVHSYKYKVRTIDSCGNASDFLAVHKTIYMNATLGSSNEVNLTWDDYIGVDYDQFYIQRNHPTTGWETIDSVSSSVYSYSDNSYPSLTGLEYSIEVIPNVTCTALKAQDHNSTRSNKVTIAAPGGGGDPSLIDEYDFSMEVYPNPSNNVVNVRVDKVFGEMKLNLIDLNGKLVKRIAVNQSNLNTINIADIESGIYFLELKMNDVSNLTKLIKY